MPVLLVHMAKGEARVRIAHALDPRKIVSILGLRHEVVPPSGCRSDSRANSSVPLRSTPCLRYTPLLYAIPITNSCGVAGGNLMFI